MFTCACGEPLHYKNPVTEQATAELIRQSGEEYATVITENGRYRVQKHYIALHGIRASDLERLATEGVIEKVV
jgi:hypothetical protein